MTGKQNQTGKQDEDSGFGKRAFAIAKAASRRVQMNVIPILAMLFMLVGVLPTQTAYGGATGFGRLMVVGNPTLSLDPNPATVFEGQTATVSVQLDPAGNTVDGVQFSLQYDATKVSVSGSVVGDCNAAGTPTDTSVTGKVRFAVTMSATSPCAVAIITFVGTAGQKGQSTNLVFLNSGGDDTTQVTVSGQPGQASIVPSNSPAGVVNVVGPTIASVTPAQGPAKSAIAVAGTNWANSLVSFFLDSNSTPLGTVTPAGGGFSTTLIIPSGTAAGAHTLKAIQDSATIATACDPGATADCKPFTVVTPTISAIPSQAGPGSSQPVTVTGTNFGANPPNSAPNNQPVTFTLTNNSTSAVTALSTTGSVTTNTAGTFTATISAIPVVPQGSYTLTASQGTGAGAVTASTPFTIALVAVTPASGGSVISADLAGTATFATLTGPVITEGGPGQIGAGTIKLAAPAGFQFDTGTTTSATVGPATGSDTCTTLLLSSGTATPTASLVTFTVTQASSGSDVCKITISNLKVQPTSGVLPNSGTVSQTNLTGNLLMDPSSTASITGVTPGITLFGILTEIPGVATSFTVAGVTNPIVAGELSDVTVKARDISGNTATGYTGTIHFTSSDAGSQLLLPSDYVFTAGDAGVHTFTEEVKLVTAGSQSVTATDTGNADTTGTQSAITVQPAAVSTSVSTVVGSASTVPANNTSTLTVTAHVTDEFGNPRSTESVLFASSRGSTDTVSATANQGGGNYSATVKSATEGSATITASVDGTGSLEQQPSVTFTVATATPATGGSAISADTAANAPGGGTYTTLTGPILIEGGAGDLGVGNIVLAPPLGFSFNTAATVTLTVAPSVALGSCNMAAASPAAFSSGKLVLAVTTASTGVNRCKITIANLQVKPNLGGPPLAAGNISLDTISTTSVLSGITASTDFGAMTEVAGAVVTLSVAGISNPFTAGALSNVTVSARDQFNNIATSYTGTVHFTSSDTDSHVVLPADYTFTVDDAGLHTFTGGVNLATAGTQSVTVTDTSVGTITGTQSGITVQAGAAFRFDFPLDPDTHIMIGDDQTVTVNQELPLPLGAFVKDAFGNTVAGVNVTFGFPAGGIPAGTSGHGLSATTPVAGGSPTTLTVTTGTDPQGYAQVFAKLGTKSGIYRIVVTATVGGNQIIGSPAVYTATATPGAPALVELLSGNNQTGLINTELRTLLAVRVTDSVGNPTPGVLVDWTTGSAPAGASGQTLVSSESSTGAEGVAHALFRLGNALGDYFPTATAFYLEVPISPGTVTFKATAIPFAPSAIISRGGDGQAGLVSTTLPKKLVIGVVDAAGNVLPGASVTFAVVSGSATVTADAGVTDADGLLAASVTLGNTPGPVVISATCSACSTTPAVSFTATVSSPAALDKVSGDGQIGTVSNPLNSRFVVAVRDNSGIPLSGVQLDVEITNGSGASLSPAGPYQTDANGQLGVLLTLGPAEGIDRYWVQFSKDFSGNGNVADAGEKVVFQATAVVRKTLTLQVSAVDILGTPADIPTGYTLQATAKQPLTNLAFPRTDSSLFGAVTTNPITFTMDAVVGSGSVQAHLTGALSGVEVPFSINADGSQSPSTISLAFVLAGDIISGTVNNRSAVGQGGAVITATEGQANADTGLLEVGQGARTVSTVSADNGTFSLAVPTNTVWILTVTHTIFGSFTYSNLVAAGSTGLILNPPPKKTVTGLVTLDGLPAEGATVSATAVGDFPVPPNVTVPGNGAYSQDFSIPVQGTAAYIVQVRRSDVGDFIPALLNINSAGSCLDANNAAVTCTVNFAAGSSALNISFNAVTTAFVTAQTTTQVGATSVSGGNTTAVQNAMTAALRVITTDATRAIAGKTFTVKVTGPGAGELASQTVAMPPDQTLTVGVSTKPRIQGILYEGTGPGRVPSQGATVDAINSVFPGNAVITREDGRFAIEVPTLGAEYTLTASKVGFLPTRIKQSFSGGALLVIEILSNEGQNQITGSVTVGKPGVLTRVTAICTDGTTFVTTTTTTSEDPVPYRLIVGERDSCTLRATADGFRFASASEDDLANTRNGNDVVGIVLAPADTNAPVTAQCTVSQNCSVTASNFGRVTLTIPSGAVASGSPTDTISVSLKVTADAASSATTLPVFKTLTGQPLAVDAQVVRADGSLVTSFALPVELSFDQVQAPIQAGGGTSIAFYNEATGSWVNLANATVTSTGGRGVTKHLTKFTLFSASSSSGAAAPAPSAPSSGGGSSGGGTFIPPPPPPTQTFDSSVGGSISTGGGSNSTGGVTIVLPPGVVPLGGVSTASITPVTLTSSGQSSVTGPNRLAAVVVPTPEGSTFGSVAFNFSVTVAGQSVTTLAKGATITVAFATKDLALAGGDRTGLKLMWFDSATQQWKDLGATVGATSLTASTTSTGLFALIARYPIPTLSAPADGTLAGLDPLLTWTNPIGTTQYEIQVIPFNNDGPGIDLIRNAETSFQVAAPVFGQGNYVMLPGMTYTWRVRTASSAVALSPLDSGWSMWVNGTFKTKPTSSASIRLTSPTAEVAGLTPTLTWTNSDSSVFYYEIQISKDPSFGSDAFLYWELVHGALTSPLNSYVVPSNYPLEAGVNYSWRVRPRVQGDGVPLEWSQSSTFKTPS